MNFRTASSCSSSDNLKVRVGIVALEDLGQRLHRTGVGMGEGEDTGDASSAAVGAASKRGV